MSKLQVANSEIVFLGLGGNLQGPVEQLHIAIQTLTNHPMIEVLQVSPFYASKPLGPKDQPDYVNAVVKIQTALSPHKLLNETQKIEREQGRIKKRHWGERLIDIDILAYGCEVICEVDLQIPHSQIAHRDFVLLPLQALSPNLQLPNLPSLEAMISALETTYVKPLNLSFE